MPTNIALPAKGIKHSETPDVLPLAGDEKVQAIRPIAPGSSTFENVNVPVGLLLSGGAGILFLSDTEASLSPEDQADLAAGELHWLYDDNPPTPVQRTTVQLTQVKNDGTITNKQASGGTDNAPALMAVQAQYTDGAFREQPAVELVMPSGGVVAYAAGQEGDTNTNKWLLRYNDVKLTLAGTTLIPIYSGSDNFFTAFEYRGEMLQNNRQAYRGTKSYFNCPRIATVAAGSRTITAINAADIADLDLYGVGKRICVYSKEVVLGEEAYPPSTKHNETPKVIVSRTATQLTLDEDLEFDHRDDYPENPFTSGGGGGRARIVPLDGPGNEYPEYFEVDGQGGKLQSSSAASPGAFGWIANVLNVHDVTITNGATVTETLTGATFTNVVIDGEFEGDKMVGPVTFTNVEVGFCSNWGGVRSFTMVGGKSNKSLQVAPPEVFLDGVRCFASTYTTDNGTKTKDKDPAVGSYVGFHNTRLFRYRNLELGADNGTSAYLNPAEFRTVTVTSVNGQEVGFDWDGTKTSEANLPWRGAQPGARFYTVDGAKIGRQVSETQFTQTAADSTKGTVRLTVEGFTPAVGDVYEFSNVLAIKDDGGHTILTPNHPARLYSEETLVWKGNQRTDGVPGPVTITKADLRFRDGGNNAYFYLRAKPTRLDFISITTANGQLEITGTDKMQSAPSYQHLASFDLNTAATRYASGSGASAGMVATDSKPTANQYRPAGFGQFSYILALHFEGLTLAQIPDDWTLTITSNFS